MKVSNAIVPLATALALLVGIQRCGAVQSVQSEYGQLSEKCQALLKSYATSSSSIGSCTGIGELAVNIFGQADSGASSTSIVPTLAAWMSSTCGRAKCTEAVVTKAHQQIEAVCADDIRRKSYLPLVAQATLKHYDLARNIVCSRADNSKKYCADDTLGRMEVASGEQFSVKYFSAMLVQPQAFMNTLKGKTWCTACLNSELTDAKPIIQSVDPSAVKGVNDIVEQKCGAKYKPGGEPKGIIEATGSKALDFDSHGTRSSRVATPTALTAIAVLMLWM